MISLDVGAGFGEAIKAIREKYREGLDIYATNLTYNENLVENLGKDKVHVTPAEFMKGFEPQSVTGIIAVASIAYSVSPEFVVQKLNDILIPGGIIKASFRKPHSGYMAEYGFQTHHEFTKRLKQLGYDVAVLNDYVVLAIKPGGPLKVRAKSLLKKDLASVKRLRLDKHWYSTTDTGNVIYHSIEE